MNRANLTHPSQHAHDTQRTRGRGVGLELIPVHIDNLNRVLPRGEFLPVPLLSCISFGPPLWLERGEAKLDFLARARRAVLALKE